MAESPPFLSPCARHLLKSALAFSLTLALYGPVLKAFDLPTGSPVFALSSALALSEHPRARGKCFVSFAGVGGGTEVASYEDPEKCTHSLTLVPGGLLFCVLFADDDPEQDEIIALDAQTLQPRHRFGLSLLSGACGMVVVGEELFVCDQNNDRLQVFSLAKRNKTQKKLAREHRRSITGEWKRPAALCFVNDR
eukprot:scaffold145467_cov96-Phaeocystis_antarctica.AAC.1